MSIRKRTWGTASAKREKWVLDYSDQKGKRRHKTFDTKKEAIEYETTMRSEVRAGTHVADRDSITVAEAADLWAKTWESENLEVTTRESHRALINYNILPLIGQRTLRSISLQDVLGFQDELKETRYPGDYPGVRVRGKKRSRDAVRRTATVLGAIFANAQLRGKATTNPVYDIPRKKRPYKKTERERMHARAELGIDIPTTEEISLILNNVVGWYSLVLVVAIFCGLRASELRGLRWVDVDLRRGFLQVRQRADRQNKLGPPKSGAGYRTISIPPSVLKSLLDWKAECPVNRHGLVFPSTRGTVACYTNIKKVSFRPTMERAGLMVDSGKKDKDGNSILSPKYSGLHALRHWYASWCINRPEDGGLGLMIKQVQERMGHSTSKITIDTYGHLFPIKDEGEALAKGEAIVRAASMQHQQ